MGGEINLYEELLKPQGEKILLKIIQTQKQITEVFFPFFPYFIAI